jgi:6-phosphofructokinase 1
MAAMRSVVEGHWGRMVALRGTDIVHVPFEEALGRLKTVPDDRYEEARVLFG